MKRLLSAVALSMTMGATSVSAQALINANDTSEILNLLKGFGSAELTTDDEGDPKFKGRIEGTRYSLYTYGCDDEHKNCDDMQFVSYLFASSYDVTAEKVNAFNHNKRFGKVSIDGDGDIKLTLVFNTRHGISRQNFDDNIDWWRAVVNQAQEHFEK